MIMGNYKTNWIQQESTQDWIYIHRPNHLIYPIP